MKKVLILSLLSLVLLYCSAPGSSGGGDGTTPPDDSNGGGGSTGGDSTGGDSSPLITRDAPIIADHTAVTAFDSIPAEWIGRVKDMFVSLAGESHATAFLRGMELIARGEVPLSPHHPDYSVETVWDGSPHSIQNDGLLLSRTYYTGSGKDPWQFYTGEQDVWTHPAAVDRLNAHIAYHRATLGLPVAAFGWMWCWDMFWDPGHVTWDPDSGWAGLLYTDFDDASYVAPWSTDDSPDPDHSNYVSKVTLKDYFSAMEKAAKANRNTEIFFITGPLDTGANHGGPGYQRWEKNEVIRAYVRKNNKVLLDYADILSWNFSSASRQTETWQNPAGEMKEFWVMWDDPRNGNEGDYGRPGDPETDAGAKSQYGGGHVSKAGTVRLAKALWWMLARMAGWDGSAG